MSSLEHFLYRNKSRAQKSDLKDTFGGNLRLADRSGENLELPVPLRG